MAEHKSITIRKEQLLLVAIIALSAFLNLFRLNQVGFNGIGNPYYAAAVQSMLSSWHNFFFLSVDPMGFVSLDKPPLAFWIQALFARAFGFNGLSLLLPEVLAGIDSVYVLYRLVRHSHGEGAGLLAALVLTVMPISVVTNRNNAPDALMILTLLLAAGALFRTIEKKSLLWLMATAVLVGIAFNIKMLQILLVVPALVVLYAIAGPWTWRKRLVYGLLALAACFAVAGAWVLAVELTPPGSRPYVGSSQNNTVINLIFGYNGIARLWGEDFTYFSGLPGPLRLFNDKLGGQVSWLLIFAGIGAVIASRQARQASGNEQAARKVGLILWITWAVPQVVYFSISIFFHRYYLATLAPCPGRKTPSILER